jgi:hypothetical protein
LFETISRTLSPSVTTLIRMDHAHVQATFHQIPGTPAGTKRALVQSACLAIEVHTRLEEEVFYPALRAQGDFDVAVLDKSEPEHAQMRHLIATLRALDAADPLHEVTLMELMRTVLHHVADEETTLLPAAERLLAGRLGELGARMTRRRLALLAPRAGELGGSLLRSLPQSGFVLAAGAVAAGAYLWGRTAPADGRPNRAGEL